MPERRARIPRFSLVERLVHWLVATSTLVLLGSGLLLYLRRRKV